MKHLILTLFTISLLAWSVDIQAYPPLSPYSYCGGNPINCIDPTGEDIVVLNHSGGQHLAMLIQDEKGKWQYYSINGNNVYNPITSKHSGGRPFNDIAVGAWNSPKEFLDSSYNLKTDDSREDKSMNNYGFTEAYQISTTSEQDATMRNSFTKIAKTTYNLFTNNCATAVQKTMIDAGIPVSEPKYVPSYIPMSTSLGLVEVFNGYKMECHMHFLPSVAFKSIIKWNPGGKYLKK